MKWLFLFLGACAAAQTLPPTPAEQRGKKLIDAAVRALGADNFLKMEDRVEYGRAYSFYRDAISGRDVATIYTRYIAIPPGQSATFIGQRERQAFGKEEQSAVLFTENGGWEISWHGTKELAKDRVERYRETTLRDVLYILRQRLNEPGMIFESRGADVFNNQPVEIVDITDSQDRLVTVYFNQSSMLPIRQVYKHYNPQTKEQDEEVTLYSRYREEGGIMWPLQIHRERNGDKVYEMFSDTLKINVDLADDLFSLPAEGSDLTKPPKRKK